MAQPATLETPDRISGKKDPVSHASMLKGNACRRCDVLGHDDVNLSTE